MSPGKPQSFLSGTAGSLQWQICYQNESQTLAAQTRGPIEATSMPGLVSALSAALRELPAPCQRLLVDLRASELQVSPASIFYLPDLIGTQFGVPRGRRMAFVFSQLDENERFLENVLKNAGLLAGAFMHVETAQSWLNSYPPHH